jgi:hypothetical protein
MFLGLCSNHSVLVYRRAGGPVTRGNLLFGRLVVGGV